MDNISGKFIPKNKWMQVHEAILLNQVFSHEVNHNPQGINKINKRIETIGRSGLKINSTGNLISFSWMIIARSSELIDTYISGEYLQTFKTGLVIEAKEQSQITSFELLKRKYKLNIDYLFIDKKSTFEDTLWKFVKALRNAISHVDYQFDHSAGDTAGKTLIIIEHHHNKRLKLRLSSSVSNFFIFTEHLGVWIDSSLQKGKLLK